MTPKQRAACASASAGLAGMLVIIVLVGCRSAATATPAPSPAPDASPAATADVVAYLGAHEPVTEGQWQQARAYAEATMQLLAEPGAQLDEHSVLQSYLEDLMLARAAAAAGFDVKAADVDAEEQRMLQVAGADAVKLEQVLAQVGLTRPAWRAELNRAVLASTYLEDVLLASAPALDRAARRSATLDDLRRRYDLRVVVDPPRVEGARVGDKAPDFTLTDTDGDKLSLSDLKGKGVILNFWATWCGPCRQEMPLLQKAFEAHGSEGLVVVGVDVGEQAAPVKTFLKELGLTFPAVLDTDQETSRLYRVYGLPTTFFIDRQGVIHYVLVGPADQALLDHQIPEILKTPGG